MIFNLHIRSLYITHVEYTLPKTYHQTNIFLAIIGNLPKGENFVILSNFRLLATYQKPTADLITIINFAVNLTGKISYSLKRRFPVRNRAAFCNLYFRPIYP